MVQSTVVKIVSREARRFDRLFFAIGLLMCASEVWKQLTLTFTINDGSYLWWNFPLQLCSIPMYLLLILPWIKSRKIHSAILAFFMSYTLLSGSMVFADTSGMQYPLFLLTLHSYCWHILLVIIGILSGLNMRSSGRRLPSYKKKGTFLYATLLYAIGAFLATAANLVFSRYGEINMFYINPLFPVAQIIFRDIQGRFGRLPALFLYLACTVLGAGILYRLWQIKKRVSVFPRRQPIHCFKIPKKG